EDTEPGLECGGDEVAGGDDERVAVEAARRVTHRAARDVRRRRLAVEVHDAPAVHETMIYGDDVALSLDLERLVHVHPETNGTRRITANRGVVGDRIERGARALARIRQLAFVV